MRVMTKEYCVRCPFFDHSLGWLEPDDPYWGKQSTECACSNCSDREQCEENGPKSLLECLTRTIAKDRSWDETKRKGIEGFVAKAISERFGKVEAELWFNRP